MASWETTSITFIAIAFLLLVFVTFVVLSCLKNRFISVLPSKPCSSTLPLPLHREKDIIQRSIPVRGPVRGPAQGPEQRRQSWRNAHLWMSMDRRTPAKQHDTHADSRFSGWCHGGLFVRNDSSSSVLTESAKNRQHLLCSTYHACATRICRESRRKSRTSPQQANHSLSSASTNSELAIRRAYVGAIRGASLDTAQSDPTPPLKATGEVPGELLHGLKSPAEADRFISSVGVEPHMEQSGLMSEEPFHSLLTAIAGKIQRKLFKNSLRPDYVRSYVSPSECAEEEIPSPSASHIRDRNSYTTFSEFQCDQDVQQDFTPRNTKVMTKRSKNAEDTLDIIDKLIGDDSETPTRHVFTSRWIMNNHWWTLRSFGNASRNCKDRVVRMCKIRGSFPTLLDSVREDPSEEPWSPVDTEADSFTRSKSLQKSPGRQFYLEADLPVSPLTCHFNYDTLISRSIPSLSSPSEPDVDSPIRKNIGSGISSPAKSSYAMEGSGISASKTHAIRGAATPRPLLFVSDEWSPTEGICQTRHDGSGGYAYPISDGTRIGTGTTASQEAERRHSMHTVIRPDLCTANFALGNMEEFDRGIRSFSSFQE